MSDLLNIIVTGSNKGIGYGIVEGLAQNPKYNIIMACRNVENGEKAKSQLLAKFPQAHINVEQLDITNKESIDNFIKVVEQKYKKIDILVNNAGVAAKGDAFDEQIARWTFSTVLFPSFRISMEPSTSQMLF